LVAGLTTVPVPASVHLKAGVTTMSGKKVYTAPIPIPSA